MHIFLSFHEVSFICLVWAKDLSNGTMDHLLSCAADGQVVLTDLNSKTGKSIFRHFGRAHRAELCHESPNIFYTCGEDGFCVKFDLRLPTYVVSKASFCRSGRRSIYALSMNPFNASEILLGGTSSQV